MTTSPEELCERLLAFAEAGARRINALGHIDADAMEVVHMCEQAAATIAHLLAEKDSAMQFEKRHEELLLTVSRILRVRLKEFSQAWLKDDLEALNEALAPFGPSDHTGPVNEELRR